MNAIQLAGSAATLVALCFTRTAGAQTIFVDTSTDVTDFGGAMQVADLPGPDGLISLAEAGLASDNTPGVQTIGFHVPPSDWQFQSFYPGRAVLRPLLGFRTFDTVILDARTQTDFTGETNPDGGGEVVLWAECYLNDSVGGAVYGFDHSSIHITGGSGNVLQGNTESGFEIFDSTSNLIGGANRDEGNTGGSVQIDRANDNVVIGNTVGRVRVLGWVDGGQPASNNRIGGPMLGDRNFIQGFGTWNSEGWPAGFAVQIFDTIGTVIENNQIGTTPDGLQQGHLATTAGISFEGENHDTLIRDNRIAGILGHRIGPYPGVLGTAISVYGTGDGVSIVGNAIGLNADGAPVLGSVTGIATTNYYLGPVQNVVIGGSAPGEGNEIAGHLATGISVANTYTGVRITRNSIHDNGGLGIDLVTDGFATGVTPNDPLDADTGGNELQNFPLLQSAVRAGAMLHLVGTLNSSASTSFTLEFFASPQCDASGFGEGEVFVGSTAVTTNASGNAAFDVSFAAASVLPGWFVTSTATRSASASTSEFSACVAVTGDASSVGTSFCFGDGIDSVVTTSCPCGNFGEAGRGCANSNASLGGAHLAASGTTDPNTLVFTCDGIPNNNLCTFLRGTSSDPAGVVFGDGVRCVSGTVLRFGQQVAGVSPNLPNTVESGTATVPAGNTRHYQVHYRNPATLFCPPALFNASNGLSVAW